MAAVSWAWLAILTKEALLTVIAIGERIPAAVTIAFTGAVQTVIAPPFAALAARYTGLAEVATHAANAVV